MITRTEFFSIGPDMVSQSTNSSRIDLASRVALIRGHRLMVKEEHVMYQGKQPVLVGVLMTTFDNLDGTGWKSRDNRIPSQFSLNELLTMFN